MIFPSRYRIYSNVKSRSYSDVFNFYFLKEVKLYQHLYNNKEIEEIKHKDLAEDPFQKEVVNYLYRKLTSQKERVVEQQLHIQSTEQSLTEFVHDIKTPVTAMKLLIDQEEEKRKSHYCMNGHVLMSC